ncbi:MAG: P-type conjugative transfer protein TrbG [Deltaproteobacteria bacterium]|nr:P-type conjugative transfer protein TrbG [Deltaproteobacteria bacterium]
MRFNLIITVPIALSLSCAHASPIQRPFLEGRRIVVEEKAPEKIPATVSGKKGVNNRLTLPSTQPKNTVSDPVSVIRRSQNEAKENPTSEAYFNAAMVYDFEPNKLYQVYTAPFRITDISLEPDESILSISGGDTTRWNVTQSSSGSKLGFRNHVLIKPKRVGLQTNLIIMTNRRTYHLEAHSVSKDSYMASISWNYSNPDLFFQKSESVKEDFRNPLEDKSKFQNLNFNYHFVTKNKPAWMPIRVFDDGSKTYIEFDASRQSRDAPGLYFLSSDGEPEVINYRSQGNFYIIDRLVDIAELRLGSVDPEVVGIERL